MRVHHLILASALLAAGSASPAIACKVLVKYPEHLQVTSGDERALYYVVAVERSTDSAFTGEVKASFGGPLVPGSKVSIEFAAGEVSNAICPIFIFAGETYLFRATTASAPRLLISRYNWLNVPSSHERFATYVQDLAQSR